jgi:hypothetical protein
MYFNFFTLTPSFSLATEGEDEKFASPTLGEGWREDV